MYCTTLSLHDALPIYVALLEMVDHFGELRSLGLRDIGEDARLGHAAEIALDRRTPARADQIEADGPREDMAVRDAPLDAVLREDRKSTRLNSSHSCASRMPSSALKKKKLN